MSHPLAFLHERRTLKAFEALPAEFRDIVFYSEGAGDWPHVGPVLLELMGRHDRTITYLSSDPADPGLALSSPKLRTFCIGSGTARTILFARLKCNHFVMTLPDLGNLWLKRSVHPVHYIYLFHSMNSTHAAYRKGAFDGYDTILCVGPYQVEEIRRTEAHYRLPSKELIEHGSVKLDTVLRDAERKGVGVRDETQERQILVAPTWGESSLIENPVGTDVIDALLRAGYRTVLRLHPMTVRRLPKLVRDLRRRYGDEPRFMLEDDMDAIGSWLRADAMVSDWSGAAIEYGFALLRPVIYVDTPQKARNPEWQAIGVVPFEAAIREEIGRVVAPRNAGELPAVIDEVLHTTDEVRERTSAARNRSVFNLRSSVGHAASYLAALSS